MKELVRSLISRGWKGLTNLNVLFRCLVPQKIEVNQPQVYFAGAIPGNYGGPRVKVIRLRENFPNRITRFNLVYVLSNFPFLSTSSIKRLRQHQIPIVLNQNGVYFPGWYGDGFSERNAANAEIYQSAEYVFWQSDFARQSARKYLCEADPTGEILYNAVDLTVFRPKKMNRAKEFTYLMAGNFNARNLSQIALGITSFEALNAGYKCRLRIAGCHSSIMGQVRNMIANRNLTSLISVEGRYSQLEAPNLLNSADAYLALKYMDTCPNLVIEALSCGLPVIYSKSGGTKELVDDSCGVGLDVSESWTGGEVLPSSEMLTSAMIHVRGAKDEMSISARHRAEMMFDINHWYVRHQEVFTDLLGR